MLSPPPGSNNSADTIPYVSVSRRCDRQRRSQTQRGRRPAHRHTDKGQRAAHGGADGLHGTHTRTYTSHTHTHMYI